ncbi:MAG: radical SAM protein [Nanoarchaeota archaeon]|nr:radical SAM protein [Nanoarchaeota archaeon]
MEKGYNPNKFVHYQDITLSEDTLDLLTQASALYNQNFDGKTWYGRCIFVSWYCSLADCTFCFRSTQRHKTIHPANSKRSMASILIEALLSKKFGWRIEFLTGGYGIMPFSELLEIMKNVKLVYGEKIWLNLGVMSKEHIEEIRPYVKGICSSLETLTPDVHKKVCPNKPIEPYDKMFEDLQGFKKSIAIIVGLGDKEEDIEHLFKFIEKHNLDRITLYALKPVANTEFTEGPSVEEYLRWIAKIRIKFPKLEIIAGTNLRRAEESGLLMAAGANAITKFPATKQFGTEKARIVEEQIKLHDRTFISNITEYLDLDWDKEIEDLPITNELKEEMKIKIKLYIKTFKNPLDKDISLRTDS